MRSMIRCLSMYTAVPMVRLGHRTGRSLPPNEAVALLHGSLPRYGVIAPLNAEPESFERLRIRDPRRLSSARNSPGFALVVGVYAGGTKVIISSALL